MIEHGDMLEILPRMASAGVQVGSCVCDPPYHLTSIVKRFGSATAAPAQEGSDAGVFWTAINPLPGRDVLSGAQAKQLGVVAGVPDLVFIYGGYSLWVELKAGKRGRLSKIQHAAHLRLMGAIDHAGEVVTITSTPDLMAALADANMTRLRRAA